jgi:hypothetical protein
VVANAFREASNPVRFDEQTYNMMVNIGKKNVVYQIEGGGRDCKGEGLTNI